MDKINLPEKNYKEPLNSFYVRLNGDDTISDITYPDGRSVSFAYEKGSFGPQLCQVEESTGHNWQRQNNEWRNEKGEALEGYFHLVQNQSEPFRVGTLLQLRKDNTYARVLSPLGYEVNLDEKERIKHETCTNGKSIDIVYEKETNNPVQIKEADGTVWQRLKKGLWQDGKQRQWQGEISVSNNEKSRLGFGSLLFSESSGDISRFVRAAGFEARFYPHTPALANSFIAGGLSIDFADYEIKSEAFGKSYQLKQVRDEDGKEWRKIEKEKWSESGSGKILNGDFADQSDLESAFGVGSLTKADKDAAQQRTETIAGPAIELDKNNLVSHIKYADGKERFFASQPGGLFKPTKLLQYTDKDGSHWRRLSDERWANERNEEFQGDFLIVSDQLTSAFGVGSFIKWDKSKGITEVEALGVPGHRFEEHCTNNGHSNQCRKDWYVAP